MKIFVVLQFRCVAVAAALALTACLVRSAGSSASSDTNGLQDKSTSYYASDEERLSIDYTAGSVVRVEGDGQITTGNQQTWTVYAKDGVKWQGTITESSDPRWKITVQWNFALEVNANGSGDGHRAMAGCYGVVQKDVTGHAGYEYDVYGQHEEGPVEYNWGAQPPDGDSTSYQFSGKKHFEGGFERIPVGHAIDNSQWKSQATVNVWIFARGWMSLWTDGDIEPVDSSVDGADFTGSMEAWDYGETPPRILQTYIIG